MATRCMSATFAFAAAAALAAQEPKPGVLVESGLAALARIEKVAGLLGFRPAQVQAAAADIGGQFPWVGADGLAHDAPIALLYLAGGELRGQEKVTFVLPVTDHAPPFAKFRNTGKRLADDMVLLFGVPMRRTPQHVLFGGVPEIVGQADPVALGKRFADESLLAYAKLDLRAARDLVPDLAEDLVKLARARSDRGNATPAYRAGQDFAAGLVRRAGRELDWAEARLERTATGLALVVEAAPAELTGKTLHADLPPGCALRFDARVPATFAEFLVATAADAGMRAPEFATLTEEQRAEAGKAMRTAGTALLGDSLTVGMRQRGDAFVLYAVARRQEQTPGVQDVAAALRRIDELQPAGKSKLQHEQYEAGGIRVERFAAEGGALDVAQRGKAICWTFAADGGHDIEDLLPIGQTESTEAASGDIDVGGLLTVQARSAPLTQEGAEFARQTAGQHLTWSLAPVPERHAYALRIDLPAALVHAIAEVAGFGDK
jgi:hypothetical protein